MNQSLAEYLHGREIRIIPVHTDTIGAPDIRAVPPEGWLEIGQDAMPGVYAAWANPSADVDGWADNVLVMVGRLTERVDSSELMDCAFVDSRRLPSWIEQSAEFVDCDGYRAATISGLYTGGELRVRTRTQYLLIDVLDHDYLVQYTATVAADSAAWGLIDLPSPLSVVWPPRGC
ncbi:LpqN/LpqT family lipoprotein [Nocardia sp. NPDC023988]|uniref:LpqN/LpqT family lipoprotein n=1 Tax=unclassified Nocardia TaxID=2637762 RepID=UPI0033FA8898